MYHQLPYLEKSGDHLGAFNGSGLFDDGDRSLGILQVIQLNADHVIKILGFLVRRCRVLRGGGKKKREVKGEAVK